MFAPVTKLLRPMFIGAASLGMVAATPAAAMTEISSGAFGIQANLGLLGLIGVGVGPLASVSGTAAPAYDVSNTVLNANETLNLGVLGLVGVRQGLSAGVLTSTASSALPTTGTGTAMSSINNLGTGLSTVLIGVPTSILSLNATTIQSTTTVDARNTLSIAGLSRIEGLTLSGLALGGLSIDGSAFVNPLPNTVLINLLGLRIVLNEQTQGGDGLDSLSLTTNAIRISFTNFAISTGLLNGDIVIGQSRASVVGGPVITEVIPEPAMWLQMIAGFGLVGAGMRARRANKKETVATA